MESAAVASAAADDETCIVAEWLRTLDLAQYTQAFVDNGYDDLETCTQIGEPDLDAIGVTDVTHRREILNAVELLSTQGTMHLYYILENRHSGEYQSKAKRDFESHVARDDTATGDVTAANDEYAEGRHAFVTFPKLHLCAIVRDKLVKYGIKLTQAPFINQDGTVDCQAFEDLSMKFASDLKTHPQDVLDQLYDLLELESTSSEQEYDLSGGHEQQEPFALYSVCQHDNRSVPPPLPVCATLTSRKAPLSPTPVLQGMTSRSPSSSSRASSFSSRHASPAATRSSASKEVIHGETISQERISEHVSLVDGAKGGGNSSSKIGKILDTIRGRTPAKKFRYKKVQGDLNASEITMGDDDRMQLMLMVKNGEISKDQAVDAVKMFESQRRKELGCSSSVELASPNRRQSPVHDTRAAASALSEVTSDAAVKLYEGTGTQMYSPVHGVRKKQAGAAAGAFSSPKSSPVQRAKLSKSAQKELKANDALKARSKTFSSPFNIRKKKSKDLSGSESPKNSISSLQNDSGVFVSPSTSRHGSFTLTSDVRHRASRQSPVLVSLPDTTRAFAAVPEQQETVQALIHQAPSHKHADDVTATNVSTFHCNRQTNRSNSDHSILPEHSRQLASAAATPATGLYLTHRTARSHSQCSNYRSVSCERCNHLHSNSCSSLHQSADVITNTTTTHALVHKPMLGQKNSISPKRRNSPTDYHGNPQSSKRQHFSNSPDATYSSKNAAVAPLHVSPPLGGGMEQESARDSSSTMSVGSETSPVCTVQRTTLRQSRRPARRSFDRQRRRSHSFSTADEYLSSDQEEARDRKNGVRCHPGRRSLIGTVDIMDVIRHGSVTSHVMKKALTRENNLLTITVKGTGSQSGSSASIADDDGGRSRTMSKRRHQTVDSILYRLALPHLSQRFHQNGVTSLAVFSELNESRLDEIGIHDPEQRAKLITAAHMLSDFEEMTSESAPSSVCNSPNRQTLSPPLMSTTTFQHLQQQPIYSSVQKCSARKQLSLNETMNSQTRGLLVPEVKHGLIRRSSSPIPGTKSVTVLDDALQLPLYENIDNFDTAIPDCERYLNNISCQCAFDAEISQVVHVDVNTEQNKYSKFYTSQSHPYHGRRATVHSRGVRSKADDRTVVTSDQQSSASSTSSPILSPVKFKDASTQHGGILHMLMRSGSLVTSSPSPGCSKVKTAEVTLLQTSAYRKDLHAATMPKLCPKHRAKHRKQSPQRLREAIQRKLVNESIDLTQPPYTSQTGECGIPAALVQRYADELQVELALSACAMEEVRTQLLQSTHMPVIPCMDFKQRCLKPTAYRTNTSSLEHFLTSVGLPQYAQLLQQNGITSIAYLLNNVRSDDLHRMGITNTAHVKRLRHELKQLRHNQPSHAIDMSTVTQAQRNDSGYSTIDQIKVDRQRQAVKADN